jgi:ribonuclease-3
MCGLLARFGRALQLDSYLVVGKSYSEMKIPLQDSMIGELYEAVLGAVFIDGGYEPVKNIVAASLKDSPDNIESIGDSVVPSSSVDPSL